MVVTIEERISAVIERSAAIEPPVISIGSDAYLDMVLHYKGKLDEFTTLLAELNADLIIDSNQSPDHALSLLPRLKRLHLTALSVHSTVSKTILAKAMNTSQETLRAEARNLREIIDDVTNIHVIMKNDDDLQSLFSQL